MKKHYDLVRNICKTLEYSEGKLTDEYLYTPVCMNLFYYKGNIGANDILQGYTDGSNDGGIDFIKTADNTIILAQGKTSDNLSKEDLYSLFDKMHRTVVDFEKGNYSKYNSTLRQTYLNIYESLQENPNLELVLFTNSVFDEDTISDFRKTLSKSHPYLDDYDIVIFDKNSIEYKLLVDSTEPEFVSEDKVEIEDANNYLEYRDNGLIVNVKASSIKRLYTQHKRNGLFNYNLREHIKQKNVDDGIENTINKESENFWFYNNGITIACEDFKLDGNQIKLYKFSVINGAQTTTKIGSSSSVSFEKDFLVVCKIVKSPAKLKDHVSTKFMNTISETSNSQKPIKLKDLRANQPEQRILQYKASQNDRKLSISIKRGRKPDNYYSVEKWQRVENEYIGQLILSYILQKPGTARSNKASIFGHDKTYNQVFKRKHDYNTLYDIVKLGNFYNDFRIMYTNELKKKPSSEQSILSDTVAKNGKFIILALIGYMIKRKKGLLLGYNDEALNEDNLSGSIISNYTKDDFEEILFDLFEYMVSKLSDLYKIKELELQLTSVSNFFKTDQRYKHHILAYFDDKIFSSKWEKNTIDQFLSIFD